MNLRSRESEIYEEIRQRNLREQEREQSVERMRASYAAHLNEPAKEETKTVKTKISIGIATLVAGMAAAVALTLAPAAAAYTPDQLPDMGYAVTVSNLGNNCHDWQVSGFGASADLGSDCDAGFQVALDEFVNRTCPCAQTTTATTTAPTTTSTTDTTTAAAPPETAPAGTTAASPAPADTTTATAAPTDTAAPAPADTTTATDTTAAAIADLTARITALEGEIQALSARVDRIALAGDASWLAFEQAVQGGSDTATAADIARGTFLNAEYGLGQFAVTP